jgi:uncharacterized protein DUF6531
MFRTLVTVVTLISVHLLPLNGLIGAKAANRIITEPSQAQSSCHACANGTLGVEANIYDQFPTLRRNSLVLPFSPNRHSTFYGAFVNFVSTAIGHLTFKTTDLELSGTMPLVFMRSYSSDRSYDSGLGQG